MENLNSPSQEQQNVQLLRCLLKEKAVTAQFLETEIKCLLRQKINQGKRLFSVGKREGRETKGNFPTEKGKCLTKKKKKNFPDKRKEILIQGLKIKRPHKRKIKKREKPLPSSYRRTKKALSSIRN